jgi:hypothetical protein
MGTDVRSEKYFVQKNPSVFPKRRRRADGTFEPLVCTCTYCGRQYTYENRRGHTKLLCNSCRSAGGSPRHEIKRRLLELRGGRCQLCGYDRCPAVLTFHHVDPSTKKFIFAGSHSRSWESQVREALKCVVLCANCHREVHSGFRELPEALKKEVTRACAAEGPIREPREGRPRFPDPCT